MEMSGSFVNGTWSIRLIGNFFDWHPAFWQKKIGIRYTDITVLKYDKNKYVIYELLYRNVVQISLIVSFFQQF